MTENFTAADLAKKPEQVTAMFDGIAKRYDLLNEVLALGQVGKWRRAVVDAMALPTGARVLDLAAGTGTSTKALRESGLDAIAADFSLGMMREGLRRVPEVSFVGADAMQLPFADNTFDGATISFGLRNVNDYRVALGELRRVVRPGGVVVVCEFSTPTNRLFAEVYQRYLVRALPSLSGLFTKNTAAYEYLSESILSWPNQSELRQDFLDQGFEGVQYRNLTGGIVALHRGFVPMSD